MLAALATLAFAAAAWIVIVAVARSIDDSRLKIAAALRGQPLFGEAPPRLAPVRIRPWYPAIQPRRAALRPALRAAA